MNEYFCLIKQNTGHQIWIRIFVGGKWQGWSWMNIAVQWTNPELKSNAKYACFWSQILVVECKYILLNINMYVVEFCNNRLTTVLPYPSPSPIMTPTSLVVFSVTGLPQLKLNSHLMYGCYTLYLVYGCYTSHLRYGCYTPHLMYGCYTTDLMYGCNTPFTSDQVWMLYSVSGVWMLYFTSEVWMLLNIRCMDVIPQMSVWTLYFKFNVLPGNFWPYTRNNPNFVNRNTLFQCITKNK